MKKSAISLFHISYWTAYLVLCLIVIGALSQSGGVSDEDLRFYAGVIVGVAIVPALFSFYTFYFFLFPNYLQKRKISQTVVASLLVSFGTFFIAAFTLKFTANMGFSCYAESNYLAVLIVGFISLVNGVVAFVIRGFVTWFNEIKMKEELQQKNHEMEMALVKSQLDPHFLFNTLNNIDILIIKDPQEASAYLNKLSDIMRFMLFETKTEEIPLERELEYINKFIELQKIRTANDHYVNYEVKGCPKNKKVAPMVFIPFIENAFKHSNNKKLKDAINIEIDIDNDQITMQCENKIDPNRHTKIESNGLGNALISKRLNLIYPGLHTLNVFRNTTSYKIDLSINYAAV
jgi:sensor histidine kinase YesM